MADTGFKHIAVTAAEEDDEVITAGMKPAAQPETAKPLADSSQVSQDPENSVSADQESRLSELDSDAGDIDAVSAPSDKDASSAGAASAANRPAKKPARKQGAYHETTLSDLEPEPMSTTQKAVIIAAVVCIIGALIYYFVFMR